MKDTLGSLPPLELLKLGFLTIVRFSLPEELNQFVVRIIQASLHSHDSVRSVTGWVRGECTNFLGSRTEAQQTILEASNGLLQLFEQLMRVVRHFITDTRGGIALLAGASTWGLLYCWSIAQGFL